MAEEAQTSAAAGKSGPSSPPDSAASKSGPSSPPDSAAGPCKSFHDPLLKQSFKRSPLYAVGAPVREDDLGKLCKNMVKVFDENVKRWRGRLNEAINKEHMTENNKLTSNPMKMDLCQTCGSFLIENDVIERTRAHETEKQHIAFDLIRDFAAEYVDRERKREEKDKLLKKIQERKESWNIDRKRKRASSN